MSAFVPAGWSLALRVFLVSRSALEFGSFLSSAYLAAVNILDGLLPQEEIDIILVLEHLHKIRS